MSSIWDEARETRLAHLWNDTGLTASEIAEAIGGFEHYVDGGRNAILGKVMRLGLAKRRLKKTPEQLEAELLARIERKRETDRRRQEAKLFVKKEKREARVIVAQKFTEQQMERAIPFADLTPFSHRRSNQCRYIVNDDLSNYLYCAAVTPPGESWCPRCREVVMGKRPILSDEERFRRAIAFKKNTLPKTVTNMPAWDAAA